LLANGRFPEAIAQARLATAELPSDAGRPVECAWLVLIAAESANGQDAEARGDLQTFLAKPRTLRGMAEIKKLRYLVAIPQLLDGVRRAGMQDR